MKCKCGLEFGAVYVPKPPNDKVELKHEKEERLKLRVGVSMRKHPRIKDEYVCQFCYEKLGGAK